ncbi:MAG: GDCCVxC domain-containing (seleno)protein [Balneolaceae bacterium]|nr:GDCCVxC domain-containing (seleno)protein [Balneolaceae bacterium]
MNSSKDIKSVSVITCPECGHTSREEMPSDSCRYFWECPGCGELLKPREGDCCVFCSFGDTPCPPVQKDGSCC